MSDRTCSVDGCSGVVRGYGLCNKHYTRWRTHGDPHYVHVRWALTLDQRFWSKVDKSGECWLWTAYKHRGYGKFFVATGAKPALAHRWAYERLVGPIPPGLHLDHLCRTPACVRPDHLEPVTNAENQHRVKAANTHCRRGHEWTPENTYNPPGGGGRKCRTCMAAYKAARKKEQVA